MRTAVVLRYGLRLYFVPLPDGPLESYLVEPDPVRAAGQMAEHRPDTLPDRLLDSVRSLPADVGVSASDTALADALASSMGRVVALTPLSELRRARSRVPPADPGVEGAFLRALARARLQRALASPEEVLVSLAREEERLERALGREERAAEAFVVAPGTPLAAYARAWKESRQAITRHHTALRVEVEAEARELLRNLSSVVGPRVAARLLAAAGGLTSLGRLRAPRLQLLGSRRRPSPEHGPRYGLIYRAERMDELPLGRRGAFARSLAALAAIAVRADTITHGDLTSELAARRDRRFRELARRRR